MYHFFLFIPAFLPPHVQRQEERGSHETSDFMPTMLQMNLVINQDIAKENSYPANILFIYKLSLLLNTI
jgi:hypothetical protein